MSLPLIEDCWFYTTKTKDERFVGRVRQFPELHTAPQKSALDARDLIITATSEKLAELAAAMDPRAGEAQPRRSGVGG